jgi:chorismate synthase
VSWDEDGNAFFAPNQAIVPQLEAYMDELRKSGDSVGARINVVATGVPVGWGEPVYDRLDADIAYAMMSINAVKGVEIGAGFASGAARHRAFRRDDPEGFLSNNAGGVLGGISSGQDVLVSMAIKPTSSTRLDRRSINKAGEAVVEHPRPPRSLRRHPRHADRRAMLALVLMDHALRHRAQNADVACATPKLPGWRRAVCSASRRRSARIDRRQLCAHRGRRVNPTRHTRLTIDREVAHGATRSSPRIPRVSGPDSRTQGV